MEVRLLGSSRARPRERRSLRSAKEVLLSVGLVHGKTWQGASDGPAKLTGTAARYAPMATAWLLRLRRAGPIPIDEHVVV